MSKEITYETLERLSDMIDSNLERIKGTYDRLYKIQLDLIREEAMLQKEANICADLKCKYMELHPKIERNDAARLFLERVDKTLEDKRGGK